MWACNGVFGEVSWPELEMIKNLNDGTRISWAGMGRRDGDPESLERCRDGFAVQTLTIYSSRPHPQSLPLPHSPKFHTATPPPPPS